VYSFRGLLPYYYPKTLKNEIYKTAIVPGILFECLNMAMCCKENKFLFHENKVLRIYEG
jgi:hypothetical protein